MRLMFVQSICSWNYDFVYRDDKYNWNSTPSNRSFLRKPLFQVFPRRATFRWLWGSFSLTLRQKLWREKWSVSKLRRFFLDFWKLTFRSGNGFFSQLMPFLRWHEITFKTILKLIEFWDESSVSYAKLITKKTVWYQIKSNVKLCNMSLLPKLIIYARLRP